MYAKRFNELVIVTTAPYKRDVMTEILDADGNTLRDVLDSEHFKSFDLFGTADCPCDICNGQN